MSTQLAPVLSGPSIMLASDSAIQPAIDVLKQAMASSYERFKNARATIDECRAESFRLAEALRTLGCEDDLVHEVLAQAGVKGAFGRVGAPTQKALKSLRRVEEANDDNNSEEPSAVKPKYRGPSQMSCVTAALASCAGGKGKHEFIYAKISDAQRKEFNLITPSHFSKALSNARERGFIGFDRESMVFSITAQGRDLLEEVYGQS